MDQPGASYRYADNFCLCVTESDLVILLFQSPKASDSVRLLSLLTLGEIGKHM